MNQHQQNRNSGFVFHVEQHGDPKLLNKLQRKHFYVAPLQPTALWAKAGTTLLIKYEYSGHLPSQNPQIWIHNITSGTEKDGPSFQKILLKEGVNKISVNKTGVIYIVAINEVDPQCHMSVTVQSGALTMPSYWRDGGAPGGTEDSPYEELVGRKMILTAPAADIKKHVTDSVGVVKLWDKIIELADEQYGLADDNPYPHIANRHRYHFFSKPDNTAGSLSSSNEWLAANKGELAKVLNTSTLLKDGWGAYHELGHQYEVTAWQAGAEVRENLTSLYVQRALSESGKATRLREVQEKINSWLARQSGDFDKLQDLFVKVAMFWQLDLAFGKNFYARLASRYRMIPVSQLPKNDDARRSKFIIEASRIAGFNLKPFFNIWGYISKEDTDSQLAALNLKTLHDPIWKNTDDNIIYTYPLDQQGIAGYVKFESKEAAPGDIVTASVVVSNRINPLKKIKWTLPVGSVALNDLYDNSVEFTIPDNAILNWFVPVSVEVSDGKQSGIIGAKIKIYASGKQQLPAITNYERSLMHKFKKDIIKTWSDTHVGNVGDIYLYDYMNTRRYFRLKTPGYWYFPVDFSSNAYWEFIGKFNSDIYLLE